MPAIAWYVASHHSRFWGRALANFLGSFADAALIFLLVQWIYELPRSKAEVRKLLAVSYGLIKRELDAASGACTELLSTPSHELPAAGPITQAWETLQSTGAFKYFSPQLSESLVKYYSLLFRMKANIELEQAMYVNRPLAVPLANAPPWVAPGNIRAIERGVCLELHEIEPRLRDALEAEIAKLDTDERKIFDDTYEPMPTSRAWV
jgi:hypothetical protein